ncbi:MAG: hypothetical protein ACLT8E_08955 [Akkermansia sp.]
MVIFRNKTDTNTAGWWSHHVHAVEKEDACAQALDWRGLILHPGTASAPPSGQLPRAVGALP